MLVAGLVCLVLGLIFGIYWLWVLGIVLLVIGLILLLVGMTGHPVGGRRHYW